MRLIKCYIENFGMYREREFSFERGLNCFLSENGTGKTTLTVFIMAMLYGFGDNRKAAADNDRKKYSPWQGGLYGGSLTFETAGRTYLVERSFGARPAEDSFALRDARSGQAVSDFTASLGEELFGIDRDGFIRTVFLSEKSIQSERVNTSVAARLSDLVGVDGDVGEYDSAIKLLEERRKFYKKRVGGEIPRLRAQISECNRELDELERMGEAAAETELRLREKEREIEACEAKRSEAARRLEGIRVKKEKRTYEDMYREKLAELDAEREKLLSLKRFFSAEPPTVAEIDAARDAYREGDRLRREATADSGTAEYARLAETFSSGTDFAELERMERTARALAEDEARLKDIDAERDERSVEIRGLFPVRVPTADEIEQSIGRTGAGARGASVALILCGILIALGGAAIGYLVDALLYAVCAIGALLLLTGICLWAKKCNGARREVRSFIRQIYPSHASEDITATLYRMRVDLERYERLRAERDEEREELSGRIAEEKAAVLGFIDRFPRSAPTTLEAILLIKEDYSRFYSLGMAEEKSARARIDKINLAEQLLRAGKDFIARFPTVTDSPFDEVRERVNEYNYTLSRVHAMEEECIRFRNTYGISGDGEGFDPDEESRACAEIAAFDEELRGYRRECAILEREYNAKITECERADEIRARRDILEDTLARYEKNHSVVLLTEELLSSARDSITSKYIGKTKERFLYYQSTISGSEGEFGVNNEFVITKTERGGARSEDSFSRGTRELFSIAMRLALTDSLYDGELPFLILDDPFTTLDDERCARARAMLRRIAKDRQILYFTCAESRAIK